MRTHEPSMSDEAVRAKTGRDWSSWFQLLDDEDATTWSHREMATWLQEDQQLSGWWAQAVAVEYERARGLREVGQASTGDFSVSSQRTIAAPVEEAMEWWIDGAKRDGWLSDELLAPAIATGLREPRTAKTAMGDVLRFRVHPDGAPNEQTVEVTFTDRGDRTTVRIQHHRIASKEERDALKARWGPELDRMKEQVERLTPGRP